MYKKSFVLIMSIVLLLIGTPASPPASGQTITVVKGPYLQQVSPDSIVIMWETDAPTPTMITYGDPALTGKPADVFAQADAVTLHSTLLTGLKAGTRYPYRVSIDGIGEAWTRWSTFFTAPEAGSDQPVRIAVYGDTRSVPDDHAAVAAAISETRPHIVLHTGELVDDGQIDTHWNEEFFAPAARLLAQAPLFPVLSSREESANHYFDLFSLPSDHEQWYATTYGPVRIIALDTNTGTEPGSPQYEWLLAELGSEEFAATAWQIAIFHHPVFTSSSESTEDTELFEQLAGSLVPLFEEYGVDIVFTGHAHHYERSTKDSVEYIVTGGGGAPLFGLIETVKIANPYSQIRAATHHFCTVDITPDSLILTARDLSGAEFDTVTLTAE